MLGRVGLLAVGFDDLHELYELHESAFHKMAVLENYYARL